MRVEWSSVFLLPSSSSSNVQVDHFHKLFYTLRLSERWKLASDNEAIASIAQEADRERRAQSQQQNEEVRLICRPPQGSDGCPNCIHETYCTRRNEQALTVSRLAGEALLSYLVRRITREQLESLREEANTQGFTIPTVLNADPIQGKYDVLLL